MRVPEDRVVGRCLGRKEAKQDRDTNVGQCPAPSHQLCPSVPPALLVLSLGQFYPSFISHRLIIAPFTLHERYNLKEVLLPLVYIHSRFKNY